MLWQKYLKRKPTRLKEYDYTQPGYYYITVCTYDRKCLFGHIINNNMQLNNAGEMANKILQELPEYYSNMKTNEFIVMPNHVHVIVEIKEPVGAALRGRPLINTGMISNNSSNKNNMMDSGPAQRPAPTGQLSLLEDIRKYIETNPAS